MAIKIPEQLIERCVQRDRTAQMELYSILFRSVYSSALRIVRNQQDAEEVAQESFLKAFRDIEKYREGLPYVLRRIAVNSSIDLLRRRKADYLAMDLHDGMGAESDHIGDEENRREIECSAQQVKFAIDSLPEGYRLVTTLHLIEGMCFEDIASELGIKSSTVRSQYVRAKQKIIEMVGDIKR